MTQIEIAMLMSVVVVVYVSAFMLLKTTKVAMLSFKEFKKMYRMNGFQNIFYLSFRTPVLHFAEQLSLLQR